MSDIQIKELDKGPWGKAGFYIIKEGHLIGGAFECEPQAECWFKFWKTPTPFPKK